jgi:8-oxo-dGTP diphosphatase
MFVNWVVAPLKTMKKKEETTLKEIVMGIVRNPVGKIIIISRVWPEKSLDGTAMLTWAFPGGNIDEGETPKEALIREIRNETGLKVTVKKKISARIHPQFNVSIQYFECEMVLSGGARPIVDVHEVQSVKWVNPKDVRNYFTTDIDPKVAKYFGI